MKKIIVKVVIGIAVILAALVAVDGFLNRFSIFNGLFKHELSIDKTANVVTQIKKISEFTSACYYEEFVVRKDKYKYVEKKIYKDDSSTWDRVKRIAGAGDDNVVSTKKDSTLCGAIVYIVKTKVRAGFDLSKLGEKDLMVKGDTLSIKLPEAEIFDIIVNPSDWEIYHREGDWEDAEIRAIQAGAKDGIKQDAIEYGLLKKAEDFGKESMISLFKTFGFGEVLFQ